MNMADLRAKNQRESGYSALAKGQGRKTLLTVKVKKGAGLPAAKVPDPDMVAPPSPDYPSAAEVILRARVEREKRIVMYSGVSFLMAAVLFFWIMNVRATIGQAGAGGDLSGIWQETQSEIEAGLESFRTDLDQIRNLPAETDGAADEAPARSPASASQPAGPEAAALAEKLVEALESEEIINDKINGYEENQSPEGPEE